MASAGKVCDNGGREVDMYSRRWVWGILFLWLYTVVSTLSVRAEIGWGGTILFWGGAGIFYGALPYLMRRVVGWILQGTDEVSERWLISHAVGLIVSVVALYFLRGFIAGLVTYILTEQSLL